jgi:predicted PurR-regulated permease PerM
MNEEVEIPAWSRRIVIGLALAVLLGLVLLVMSHFGAALAWAVILTLTAWPLHRRLRRSMARFPRFAAFATTALIVLVVIIPIGLIGLLLSGEVRSLVEDIRSTAGVPRGDLVEDARGVPVVGGLLADLIVRVREDPDGTLAVIAGDHRDQLLALAGRAATTLARNFFKLAVCLFAVFFLLLYGEAVASQCREAGRRIIGARYGRLEAHVGQTVKAVVYGLVMTAIVQALFGALGMWVAGVPFAWLLGALTLVLAFVPMGHALVWGPAAGYLLLTGHHLEGILLIVWGAAVVGSVDNVLRPIFIGQRSRLPILLVFFGVVGGLLSFGFVGLFVGPVVIAVALALWREWLGDGPADPADGVRPDLVGAPAGPE